MIILSISLKLFGENKILKSVKLLPLNIKSISTKKKYLHLIESWTGIL